MQKELLIPLTSEVTCTDKRVPSKMVHFTPFEIPNILFDCEYVASLHEHPPNQPPKNKNHHSTSPHVHMKFSFGVRHSFVVLALKFRVPTLHRFAIAIQKKKVRNRIVVTSHCEKIHKVLQHFKSGAHTSKNCQSCTV